MLGYAADVLGALDAADVPPSLRRVATFQPTKRARLGAGALAAALETNASFRQLVADAARVASPELADAIDAGTAPPLAPPEDVAALAYLLRPNDWGRLVGDAAAALQHRAARLADSAAATAARRELDALEAVRAADREEADRLRAELAAVRDQLAVVRREARAATDAARAAESAAATARSEATDAATARDRAIAEGESALRRSQRRVAELEKELQSIRRDAREARAGDDQRLRILLNTLIEAAHGLRHELALPPGPGTDGAGTDVDALPTRTGGGDDVAWLEALVRAPRVHVLVDGYNVTKTGYPDLSLADQRGRLVGRLGALTARTGARVTVVFDGRDRVLPAAAPTPRGVAVRFSKAGQTADDVIVALAAAEPHGRPLVVVSSDNEVVEGVRRAGATAVPSVALVALLERA